MENIVLALAIGFILGRSFTNREHHEKERANRAKFWVDRPPIDTRHRGLPEFQRKSFTEN